MIFIDAIKSMYNIVVTSVRTTRGETNIFSITIGSNNVSVLSPHLFASVIDDLTKNF